MTSTNTPPIRHNITFIQNHLPILESGKYTIQVEQTVSGSGKGDKNINQTYSTSHDLYVKGDRFRLNPADIKSVFPANYSQGDFSNVLPHIVLTKKGLPWEWSLDGGPQSPKSDSGNIAPWLGLLVFHETDPVPKIKTGTLDDLKSDTVNIATYPPFELEPWEKETDLIQYTDVPIELFNRIAPTKEDLPWLAHCRTISMDGQIQHPENANPEYSVVIANRLPQGHSTVCLVCLKGMADYLPDSNGKSNIPQRKTSIRLAVLKHWSFTTSSVKESKIHHFVESLNNLNIFPSTLQLPYAAIDGDETEVENAFKMGYMAFNHHTRQGDKTVSWYRGPLVPYEVAETITVPILDQTDDKRAIVSADSLVRYNPETGLFDESYAAAWQLGQLLALQNKQFATTLYEWKRMNQRATVQQAERQLLQNTLGANLSAFLSIGGDESAGKQHSTADGILDWLIDQGEDLFNEASEVADESVPEVVNDFNTEALDLSAIMTDPDIISTLETDAPSLPDYVKSWLGKLLQLKGVPFHYLVPDERMLPVESMRFFHVDRNWLTCLLDGAYSIGRVTAGDAAHDTQSVKPVLPQVSKMSGFLLRSAVVSDYPGLRVEALVRGKWRKALRLEKLSPNVLLGLFEGIVQQVKIHPPPEGLHFGLDISGSVDISLTKSLRYVQGNNVGQLVGNSNSSVTTTFRNYNNNNALRVSELAHEIRDKLRKNPYTSAEFALEMVESVPEFLFDIQ